MINVNIVTLPDSLAEPNYGRAINFIQMILDIYLVCNLCKKIPHVWVAIECRLGLRLGIKVLLLHLGIWLVLGLTVELFHWSLWCPICIICTFLKNNSDDYNVYTLPSPADYSFFIFPSPRSCDYCAKMYHGKCVGVEPLAAKFILKYACPPCRGLYSLHT